MISRSSRYSPKVALTLLVGDHQLALSRVGPKDVLVRDRCEPIPPSDAQLVITIDDASKTYDIFLPNGIPAAPQRVTYL
jgi:hypothetical protein